MTQQELEQQQQQPEENQTEPTTEGNKRKLEDKIELAKQKAQEIASRLLGDAESKRPRLGGSENNSDTPPAIDNSSSAASPSSVPSVSQSSQYHGVQISTKKITIPNAKVGVVIGRGGETIKYIQFQSGAKIQITRDPEAISNSLTRDVELTGTSEQVNRAEQLINDVIAEADAGGSASSDVTKQSGGTQFSMKIPNDKVGLLIGKGGETIKYMQNKTGARMQIIPLHLPPGDPSTERTIYINGSTDQIEAAKELVNEVISGKRIINPSAPTNYVQPGYAMQQQPPYAYPQPPQYNYGQVPPSSYYGNYSTQQPSWDQSNPSQTPQQTTAYGYYGQSQMGSAPNNPSYNYGQAPAASTAYDQSYSQQLPSYGQNMSGQAPVVDQQNQYAASTYGVSSAASQSDGTISQTTQAAPTYLPSSYSQQMSNPQTYWNASGYTGQPSAQTAYDQTGYSQGSYGQAPHYATKPVYGQAGYPVQPDPAPPNYTQGTQPHAYGQQQVEAETQLQPHNNDLTQSSANGIESHDGNSNSSVPEAAPQS